jgi:hypothetical protein
MEQVAIAEGSAALDRSMAMSIAAGDASAFERMMRQYNRRLYRLARATSGVDHCDRVVAQVLARLAI